MTTSAKYTLARVKCGNPSKQIKMETNLFSIKRVLILVEAAGKTHIIATDQLGCIMLLLVRILNWLVEDTTEQPAVK